MKTMSRTARTVLCLMALLGVVLWEQAVYAAFTEYTTSFSFVDGPTHNVTINKFDTALGTLTGITVYLDVNLTGQVQVINYTSNPQNFTNAYSTGPFSFTGPGGTIIGAATSDSGLISGTASPPPFTITTVSGTPAPYHWAPTIDGGSFGLYEGGVADLATFIAAAGPYTSGGSGTPGAVGFSGSSLIDGTLKIHYDYTAVPIPAALWLLGSGLVGLVGLRRRINF